jgi:hypothetical protein
MRRLLLWLPIALLILMAFLLPYFADANSHLPIGPGQSINDPVHTSPPTVWAAFSAVDNTSTGFPEGLTLSPGIPFISPIEVDQGKTVTIKVKATNSSPFQINYALSAKVNGKAVGTSEPISLEPAGSQDLVFQLTAQDSGNNEVRIGDLKGSFTVKGGSFFDIFPPYLWGFFGIVLGVIVMLTVLVVTKPAKMGKKGIPLEQGKKPANQKGKPAKPGGPGHYPMPGGMPRPAIPGMPDGMPMGMQGPGQPASPYDMPVPGMQPPFQQQAQPGMPPPFQPQTQPGMPPPFQQGMQPPFQQPFQQGMQPPSLSGPQYPQPPHMPQVGQPTPQQPPMQGMRPGMPQPGGHGMQPPMANAPADQPGMPFGMQPPPQHMPPGMQAYPPPGMQQPMHAPGQPPLPPSMQPGMYPPSQGGMQQMPGAYQAMGMPKFSVSNLTITPNNVKAGDQVIVSIIVSNNGIQTGKYSVVLRIGGVVENISDVTLPPGANQTASFAVVKDAPGDYYADIDGLGGFFTVIPLVPPSFIVSNFSISPERVRQGQPVIVTATVTNTGEISGNHPCILRVKGIAEAQQEVTLGPGKTQEVEFQIIKDIPGFYPVSMENWTGKFVIEMDWTG